MAEAMRYPCHGHFHYTETARIICLHGLEEWIGTDVKLKVGDLVMLLHDPNPAQAPIGKKGEVVYIDEDWKPHTRYCVAFDDYEGDVKMLSFDHILTPDGNGWWCWRGELRKLHSEEGY